MANLTRENSIRQERGSESQRGDGQARRHRYANDERPQYSEASTTTPSEYSYRRPRERPLEVRANWPSETPPGCSYSYNYNSHSPAWTHDPGYAEHNACYAYAYPQYNAPVGSAQNPHGDSPSVPQPGIRRSRTGPDISPSAAYIAPILLEHRGSMPRVRRSIGKLAKGDEEGRKRGEVTDGEDRYSNSGARPYIAPILPEHHRGILKARRSVERSIVQKSQARETEGRQAEKENKYGINGMEQRISPSQRGEVGREHPREQYPTANHQGTYNDPRDYPHRHERQHKQGNHSSTPQNETPVYTPWRPDHEPTDDEFDYIYEPEGRILTENPNPTRK